MPTAKKRIPALSARGFWLCVAGLAAVKLALASFQTAYIWVGGAPLDDELMFRAANAISAGDWLGRLRLPDPVQKHVFCGVAGAAQRAAPALSGHRAGAVVRGGAAGVPGVLALAAKGRAGQLGKACRVLRRWPSTRRSARRTRCGSLPGQHLPGAVPGLLCRVLRRGGAGGVRPGCPPLALAAGRRRGPGRRLSEPGDAGLFLLPFAVLATAVLAWLTLRQRRPALLGALAWPFALLAAGVLAFCGAELAALRRVCAVGFLQRQLCRRHGGHVPGGSRRKATPRWWG